MDRRTPRKRAAGFLADFVRRKVDVIHVNGNPDAPLIAKQVTSVIPIVFAVAGDPVGTGLVASLARPGGNVPGLSNQLTDAAGKRVELLREVVPGLHRLAIMANVASTLSDREIGEVRMAAGGLGLEVITAEIRGPGDIAPAFDALKGRAEALYVANDGIFAANQLSRHLGIGCAAADDLCFTGMARSWRAALLWHELSGSLPGSAELVDKILRGTKPADIPVEQPTKFDVAVNLITAKALGLPFPSFSGSR